MFEHMHNTRPSHVERTWNTTNGTHHLRLGIVALRDVSAQWTDARVQELRVKRDFVLQRLREMPGVVCQTPEGAFYALPDISCCMSAGSRVQTAEAFCKVLLEESDDTIPGEM